MNAYLEQHARIVARAPSPNATEGERLTWDLEDRWGYERNVRRKLFRKMPERFQAPVAEKYRDLYATGGNFDANRYLYEVAESVTIPSFRLAASDSEICDKARNRAELCHWLVNSSPSEEIAFLRAVGFCRACGFNPISLALNVTKGTYTRRGALHRMCDQFWWRRQLRR